MNRFQKIHSFIDQLFELIGDTLLMFMKRVAPFVVILPPAFFLAHAVAKAATALAGPSWGLAVGITAAAGLEAAGMYAPYQATQLYKRGETFWWIPAIGALLYVAVGVSVLWIVEDVGRDAKVVGTAMYLIALLVYVMLGIDTYIATARREESATAESEMELKIRQAELDAEVKKERIRAKADSARTSAERLETSAGRSATSNGRSATSVGRSADYDQALANVRLAQADVFGLAELQTLTGRARTAAYELLTYGIDTGQVERAGRGQYRMNGNGAH